MIIRCGCKHDFQDKTYGEGMRVFNPIAKEKTYRCTVCKKEVGKGDEGKKR